MEKVAQVAKTANRAPKAKTAEGLESGTFYTVGGTFYAGTSSGWVDATSDMSSIEVTVNGDSVFIAGLAYWFKEGALAGTIDGNTLTFPCQLIGTDQYGDEFLIGSNDASTVTDIVFTWDQEAQTLTASTALIIESGAIDAISAYCYWSNAVFSTTEPEAPELVVLPEGATVVEYTMDFVDGSGNASAKSVNVAVVENEVFFQGMSNYLPEAWVVGTKEGNAVTFAANQYVGDYQVGSSYFFYNGETVFTYDEEADTYSASGQVCGVLANQYYDGNYDDPVLSKAKEIDLDNPTEVAIVEVLSCKYDASYGDVIYKLANATSDTIFQFDIYLEEGQTDVELGQTYTFENMETSATYSFVQADESKLGFKAASFVKTAIGETDSIRIEATVVDGANNVYHFAFAGVIEVPTPVVVPEDLETAAYLFKGTDTYFNEEEKKFIQVGFDADTVYLQGLSSYVPEAWIKGVIATDGTVTLAPCYLGVYSSLFGSTELSFAGGELLYDAEANKFTADELTTVDEDGSEWDEYADITITLFVEVAATPADPEFTSFAFADTNYPNVKFNIPLEGTEGEDLNPEKLSYIFFVEKEGEVEELVLTTDLYTELEEDLTEIPYTFTDNWDIYSYVLYLNQSEEEVRSWDKLGLQSIYRGLDEEHKSNIVWFDVKAYWEEVDGEQGIENIVLTEKVQKVVVDGAVYVIRDNKLYNILGTQVR
ncbi:MAG: hypothetical protein IJS82_05930 [Paludibacteraceae bacterium]|nr:hypothetical protein [Paludibacteraceae bacterium]